MITATQVKIALAVAGVVALFGGGWWAGAKVERANWLERELDIQAEASEMRAIAAEDAAVDAQEQASALVGTMAEYVKGLEADRANHDRIVADLRTRNQRLSIRTTGCTGGGDAPGAGHALAGKPETAARAELHPEAVRFLDGEARRADANTLQLNAVIGALEACERLAKK